MTKLLTVCKILSRSEVKSCHFSLLNSDCRHYQRNAQQYQCNLYIAEKYI